MVAALRKPLDAAGIEFIDENGGGPRRAATKATKEELTKPHPHLAGSRWRAAESLPSLSVLFPRGISKAE
jgi:hypothetical protein